MGVGEIQSISSLRTQGPIRRVRARRGRTAVTPTGCQSGVMGPRVRGDDVRSQHLMDVDDHALGVARGRSHEQVFHQPAILRMTGLEARRGAEVD